MASPAVAAVALNGLLHKPASEQPQSPQSVHSSLSTTKRKRHDSDEGTPELNGADGAKPTINGHHPIRDEKTLIHNYFDVLQRYDTNPPILKRPIPEPFSAEEEPDAKRQKADEAVKPASIGDKVAQDGYTLLDDLVIDVKKLIKDRVAELRTSGSDGDVKYEEALMKLNEFRVKAQELHAREMSYPKAASEASKNGGHNLDEALQASAVGSTVLTVWGDAGPQKKHLFSSLQKRTPAPDHPAGVAQPLPDVPLPNGVSMTTVVPSAAVEKPTRPSTLGELFPAPRNLPPLQPPKAPKTTTKSNVLGFYHPELAERSKYRAGSYFSQPISTGQWLDYSNATPTSQIKTRQRERAQSLAGHKPSSTELEMTEMEALFRGAFSSFAPSKDDTAAMVPSGQLGRMWWQKFGQRNFQRLIDAELPEEEVEEAMEVEVPIDIDEDLIRKAIDEFDDSLVDPGLSLEDVMAKKPDHDKDIDDTLEEVSDLIETLSSYQRNRNLTLPTSQNRSSADPAIADMLNGSLAQQPTEEEIDTYQMLKNQLSLIVKALPPYAVARLNSDKLEDLNISTKLEVRSDEYKGVLEEDEPAARIRHQQAAMQAANAPRAPTRAPSMSSTPATYGNQQYGRQFPIQSQSPVPVPNHYPQTPARPMQATYQRTMSGPGPMSGVHPQQQQQQQQRPPAGQPFRPNGFPFAQHMQAGRPYGAPTAVPPYQGTPQQQRVASHPSSQTGYANGPPQGPPGQRYPQGHPGQVSHQPQGMQPQQHPQRPGGYAPHVNGASPVPQRTLSPHVSGHYQPAYGQSPQQPQHPQQVARAASYGTPGQPGGPAGVARYPTNFGNTAVNTPQSAGPGTGTPGWHTTMSQAEINQINARARLSAQLSNFGDKLQQQHQQQQHPQQHSPQQQHSPHQQHPQQHHFPNASGLAGIGLGHTHPVDMAKFAAARAGMPGGIGQSSPSPRPHVAAVGPPPGVNGASQQQQYPQRHPSVAAPSPASMPGATPSPAPSAGMQPRPPA